MDFIDVVEKIREIYINHNRSDIALKIRDCLMQGGTYGERFLILADMLRKLKKEDEKTYQIAEEYNKLILEGADEFFRGQIRL
jgi:hypothetical protein